MALTLEPISPGNLESVAQLLQERNGTLPAYTRWKYGQAGTAPFRGVVARWDGEAVGCFGLIGRDLELPSGEVLACGWFADWYVSPRAQGQGIGRQLLQAVSGAYPIVFGHPGPEQAQSMCRTQGYRPLAFQSRRRLVLRRLFYASHGTRFPVTALPRALAGLARSAEERRRSAARRPPTGHTLPRGSQFADSGAYGYWIMGQPAAPRFSRRFATWADARIVIVYSEDRFPDGLVYRRVLHAAGEERTSPAAWALFLRKAREAGCASVEAFTTEPALDHTWASLGAWQIPEAPVLVTGCLDRTAPLALHGWDRENWTYRADGDNG